jgi:hypothetical protein
MKTQGDTSALSLTPSPRLRAYVFRLSFREGVAVIVMVELPFSVDG